MNHILHIVDVESSGSEVGRHQYRCRAVVEEVNRELALTLFQTPVIQSDRESLLFQVVIDPLGTFAVVDENQHFPIVEASQEVFENGELVTFGGVHSDCLEPSAGWFAAGEVEGLRFSEPEEVGHLGQGGGRGEDYQLWTVHTLYDAFHLVVETKFERLVILVKHERLDIGQSDSAAFEMVEQSSGSGHDDVGHHREGVDFIGHLVSAVESHGLQTGGHGADDIGDLYHQLAGGSHHYRLHFPI